MTEEEERETDQSIDLAFELMRAHALKQIEEMEAIAWKEGDFRAGWESACEEFKERLSGVSLEDFTHTLTAPEGEEES